MIEPGKLPNTGKVVFGATVELEDQDNGERVTYQIVGEDEADIRAGRISITSPIARALVGKSEGEWSTWPPRAARAPTRSSRSASS